MKQANIIGKVEELIEVLKDNKVAITSAGVLVDALVSDLETKKAAATKLGAQQEGLKTQLKDGTEAATAALSDLYEFFSSKVDAVAGSVGKKKNLAQQILKVRSSLRGRPGTKDEGSADEAKAA
jgi:hypothetical protein